MKINVDKEYYYNIYGGDKYDDIDRILKRAADIVELAVLVPVITDEQQEAYKNAVCAEAEYIGNMGGTAEINSSAVSSFSLGKFSMSMQAGSSGNSTENMLPTLAVNFLDRAGLLYRGL